MNTSLMWTMMAGSWADRAPGRCEMAKPRSLRAPLSWRLRNTLRWGYVWGWLTVKLAWLFSYITGIPTLTSELRAQVRRADGVWIDYGVLSWRVVTTAGATFLASALTNSTEAELLNYHGVGTGTNAEASSDTALQTECTTVLNPDSTRATGVQTNPTGTTYKSVGTLTFDGSAAVTEQGIFSQAATGGGTLLDRSVFAAINVASGDTVAFPYTLTINAGG